MSINADRRRVLMLNITDVTQIFSMSEDNSVSSEYAYSEQKPITGKAKLVFSGEGLKKYSLPIKLHYSYCNPSRILKDLEQKAQNAESFSYFQQSEYIGEFVISRIDKKIISRLESQILYAEITVELLECQNNETQYTQKKNPDEELFNNAKTQNQNALNDPVAPVIEKEAKSLFDTLSARAFDWALGQAENLIDEAIDEVLNE